MACGEQARQKTFKKKALTTDEIPAKASADYIPAMLAKDADKPFSNESWIYEIKGMDTGLLQK